MTFRGDHVDELISASLSGDLTDAERVELDAHLAGCDRCRATLAAFSAERRILSRIRTGDPPSDLSARVRNGIDAGRFPSSPWWRRPGSVVPLVASAAVFAAVVLAVTFFTNLRLGPVGQASRSPEATLSLAPSSSAAVSTAPSVIPTAPPLFALSPGELGYLVVRGGPPAALRLSFIADTSGKSIDLGTISGPPIAAALSPDGRWLAYITQKGQTGANEVWVAHLTNGNVVPIGCSVAAPFTDRLAWSADGVYLAYTVVAIDLGPTAGCPAIGAAGSTDAWFFDTPAGVAYRVTTTGDAYAASFQLGGDPHTLLVSHAARTPWTEAISLVAGASNFGRVDGAFMPLFSPDGNRALFWNGTMVWRNGVWQFSLGGMPQLSRDFRSTGPASPWLGTPLFTDLVPAGGEAFAYGSSAWGPDSDRIAFWNGAWTGAPQSADGSYPGERDVYVSRVSTGALSSASRLALTIADQARVVQVTFVPDGSAVAVTVGLPSAGIGAAPSAKLEIVPLGSGQPRTIVGGVNPPPWTGLALFGR